MAHLHHHPAPSVVDDEGEAFARAVFYRFLRQATISRDIDDVIEVRAGSSLSPDGKRENICTSLSLTVEVQAQRFRLENLLPEVELSDILLNIRTFCPFERRQEISSFCALFIFGGLPFLLPTSYSC